MEIADVSRPREVPHSGANGLFDVWTDVHLLASGRLRCAGAAALAYHDVGRPGDTFTRYSVTPADLRRHLTTARSWGVRFVTVGELIDKLTSGASIDGLACVTFDDCLVGVHRHAVAILADLGIPGTLFAPAGAFGRVPEWWNGSAAVMTAQELKEMADAGFTVGSHGWTHRSLCGLSPRLLDREVWDSRRALEDLLGRSVDLFAYPFGHHDEAARTAVRNAAYTAAFTFVNGRLTHGIDVIRLPRLTMHHGLRRLRLAHYLARPAWRWPDTQLDYFDGR